MRTRKKVKPEVDAKSVDMEYEIAEFRVVFLHNHNDTYHPGQYVEGHLLVHVVEPIATRDHCGATNTKKKNRMIPGITVHFSGTTEIFWTQLAAGRGAKCVDTVEFSAAEEYFNSRIIVQDPGYLVPGVVKYPFKFHLSPPLPESYEDTICRVEYYVEGRLKLDSNTRHDLSDRREVLLVSPLDLNEIIIPDVTLPVMTQVTGRACCWCCKSKPITAFLRLQRSGYSPGEIIYIQADVENMSRRSIPYIEFRLIEISEYITKRKTHKHREVIATVREGSVAARETKEMMHVELEIPKRQLFNVDSSRIFNIRHVVEMEACPKLSREKLLLSLDLVLGGIPMEKSQAEKPTHLRLQNHSLYKKRETAADIEREAKKKEKHKWKKINKERERRKEREKKIIIVSEETDTSDYKNPGKMVFR